MMLLAMALLAEGYPAFNADDTREICRVKVEGEYKDVYDSIEACVDDHHVDYRRFVLLAARGGTLLAPAFRACVTEWTSNGKIDWGMTAFCAIAVADGKRDYDMFLEAAPNRRVRARIRGCVARWTDEETRVVDWDMVGDCAGEASEPGTTYRAEGGDVVILTGE
ncbi:hypothetical protein OF829_13030 [Sphingomonas sp. LB-2]|uniref:hypothetical protein n=1 Tax=Sphingomonas caeni TaxID=2984949 RepID=UPI0022327337|nr:hypothetical protein [Sphingomonas caeni]MCW3848165.1 hypothetical protein [Sphingomonas caeni]